MGVMLAFFLLMLTNIRLIRGKAFPEDSLKYKGQDEYDYNQDKYPPFYGSYNFAPNPEIYYTPQINGQPIFIPPVSGPVSSLNEYLKDYYNRNERYTQSWTLATPVTYDHVSEGDYFQNRLSSKTAAKVTHDYQYDGGLSKELKPDSTDAVSNSQMKASQKSNTDFNGNKKPEMSGKAKYKDESNKHTVIGKKKLKHSGTPAKNPILQQNKAYDPQMVDIANAKFTDYEPEVVDVVNQKLSNDYEDYEPEVVDVVNLKKSVSKKPQQSGSEVSMKNKDYEIPYKPKKITKTKNDKKVTKQKSSSSGTVDSDVKAIEKNKYKMEPVKNHETDGKTKDTVVSTKTKDSKPGTENFNEGYKNEPEVVDVVNQKFSNYDYEPEVVDVFSQKFSNDDYEPEVIDVVSQKFSNDDYEPEVVDVFSKKKSVSKKPHQSSTEISMKNKDYEISLKPKQKETKTKSDKVNKEQSSSNGKVDSDVKAVEKNKYKMEPVKNHETDGKTKDTVASIKTEDSKPGTENFNEGYKNEPEVVDVVNQKFSNDDYEPEVVDVVSQKFSNDDYEPEVVDIFSKKKSVSKKPHQSGTEISMKNKDYEISLKPKQKETKTKSDKVNKEQSSSSGKVDSDVKAVEKNKYKMEPVKNHETDGKTKDTVVSIKTKDSKPGTENFNEGYKNEPEVVDLVSRKFSNDYESEVDVVSQTFSNDYEPEVVDLFSKKKSVSKKPHQSSTEISMKNKDYEISLKPKQKETKAKSDKVNKEQSSSSGKVDSKTVKKKEPVKNSETDSKTKGTVASIKTKDAKPVKENFNEVYKNEIKSTKSDFDTDIKAKNKLTKTSVSDIGYKRDDKHGPKDKKRKPKKYLLSTRKNPDISKYSEDYIPKVVGDNLNNGYKNRNVPEKELPLKKDHGMPYKASMKNEAEIKSNKKGVQTPGSGDYMSEVMKTKGKHHKYPTKYETSSTADGDNLSKEGTNIKDSKPEIRNIAEVSEDMKSSEIVNFETNVETKPTIKPESKHKADEDQLTKTDTPFETPDLTKSKSNEESLVSNIESLNLSDKFEDFNPENLIPRQNENDKITSQIFHNIDSIRSLSNLNSNIWSLIFNPNAERNKLKKCVTPSNETGYCMYIQNCEIPNIATTLEQLLNNACVMDEVFIGICCPEFPVQTVKVHWEQMPSNSEQQTEDEFGHKSEDCGSRSDEASKSQSWPWKAPLVSMSNGKIFCGGVVINEHYILTAAHCTTKIPKNQILVRLGQHDESSGEDFAVVEIKRHAQYNPRTMHNDIALLKLGRRIVLDVHTGVVCLPDDDDDDDHAGEQALLLGWQGSFGKISKKDEVLDIISNADCNKRLNSNIPSSVLCTETRNESERTCNADSGAPLVIKDGDKYEVIGILSWNRNDCDQRFPSTFSRVAKYVPWIKKHSA